MKLVIDNIAKIEQAEVEFDGLTVICGRNDTGKSTLGKVLFATFNALNNMDQVIADERYREIRSIAERILIEGNRGDSSARSKMISSRRMAEEIASRIVQVIEENEDAGTFANKDTIEEVLDADVTLAVGEETRNKLKDEILKILEFPQTQFLRAIVERWYFNVFGGQISQIDGETDGHIRLVIKSKEINLAFRENQCEDVTIDIPIIHRAFLVDNPHIIDDLPYGYNGYGTVGNAVKSRRIYDPQQFLRYWLYYGDQETESIVSEAQTEEKLEEVSRLLEKAIPGETVELRGRIFLRNESYKSGLLIENLSMGLKSLYVIKRLLEQNALKPKDVIIFDEPEIHLHPELQILYAQILVLLQRAFDLTMVVTTHSHYFLEAIDLYSRMHDRQEIVHYYLADAEDNKATFTEVTDHLEDIYELMADPITLLDNLRMELQNKDEA